MQVSPATPIFANLPDSVRQSLPIGVGSNQGTFREQAFPSKWKQELAVEFTDGLRAANNDTNSIRTDFHFDETNRLVFVTSEPAASQSAGAETADAETADAKPTVAKPTAAEPVVTKPALRDTATFAPAAGETNASLPTTSEIEVRDAPADLPAANATIAAPVANLPAATQGSQTNTHRVDNTDEEDLRAASNDIAIPYLPAPSTQPEPKFPRMLSNHNPRPTRVRGAVAPGRNRPSGDVITIGKPRSDERREQSHVGTPNPTSASAGLDSSQALSVHETAASTVPLEPEVRFAAETEKPTASTPSPSSATELPSASKNITLRLDSPELGKVQVHISNRGSVQAKFVTQSESAFQAISTALTPDTRLHAETNIQTPEFSLDANTAQSEHEQNFAKNQQATGDNHATRMAKRPESYSAVDQQLPRHDAMSGNPNGILNVLV